MTLITSKSDIKPWLDELLKNEDIDISSFNILGNSEKGDGYMGDIFFVEVNGITKQGHMKKYDLVLKCSKTSQVLREKSPVKEAFLNEMRFYNSIFPSFLKFQQERNVDEPFEKVPKCYGTYKTDHMEIIALENLKSKGFILWDKTKPLTRRHIDMIVQEYGKFHGTSLAMKELDSEQFYQLADGFHKIMHTFGETTEMYDSFEDTIDEVANLLKDELENSILKDWVELKSKVRPFFTEIFEHLDAVKVITHGDCWTNNFMHCHVNGQPSTFVMLDWQLLDYTSPILDLSYFLFTCLSEEDMNDMDSILKHYHNCLVGHSLKLGSNIKDLYPINQFLNDWKRFCKYGIFLTPILNKMCLSEKDNIPDMAEAAEKGEDIIRTFSQPIKNIDDYKIRMKYIVKYVVENNLC